MSTLTFFPWLKVENQLTVGDFTLIPYKRGILPFGANSNTQEKIDNILEPYVERGTRPINRATLLQIKDKDIIDDLEQKEANTIFIFSELLAVSGLSKRKFFNLAAADYCNRDIFRPVVQSFTHSDRGTLRKSRRRDGITATYTTRDALRIHRPEYLSHPLRVTFDLPLLYALIKAQATLDPDQWSSIFESITNFNFANTDSDYFAIQIEAVLLISAFERLFGCGGNENALARCFTSTLSPRIDIHPSVCSRLSTSDVEQRFRNSNCIRDIWIRDFFRLRGNLAHGSLTPDYPSLWNIRDHLLLSSFIFPFLLKYKLADLSFYTLSDDDRVYINAFEKLACYEHCIPQDREKRLDELPWNRVISETFFESSSANLDDEIPKS